MERVLFSQRDKRWSDIHLGTAGGMFIGGAGCLLSVSAAMLRETFSVSVDPGVLNRWLCRNSGYTHGNLLVFDALRRAALELGGVELAVRVIDCANVPAPLDQIDATLDGGGGVLVLVDFHPGGAIQQHWIRILERDASGGEADYIVHDPWLPAAVNPYRLMPRYAHYSWSSPARVIFRIVLYRQAGDAGALPPASKAGAVNEAQEKLFLNLDTPGEIMTFTTESHAPADAYTIACGGGYCTVTHS